MGRGLYSENPPPPRGIPANDFLKEIIRKRRCQKKKCEKRIDEKLEETVYDWQVV
jgi:hypothetical protein